MERELTRDPNQVKSKEEVAMLFNQELQFFENATFTEDIYRLALQRLKVKDQVQVLRDYASKFELKAERRNKLVSSFAFLLAAAQFGVGYYCIYEVSWLGWDLVEPWTYTIMQGLFVSGLFYSQRYLGQSTAYTDMAENLKQRRLRKWFRKSGFDYDRLLYLEKHLKEIDAEI